MGDWEDWVAIIREAHETLDETDYYKLLSVPRDADKETIRKAYYQRALTLHPDKVMRVPEPYRTQAIAIYKRIAEAYQALTNPEMRKAYEVVLKKGKKRLFPGTRFSMKPKGELDFCTTEAGKKYYKAAKEALDAGNIAMAKINVKLAHQYEGDKPEVLRLVRRILSRK